jgi:hypothetical protein
MERPRGADIERHCPTSAADGAGAKAHLSRTTPRLHTAVSHPGSIAHAAAMFPLLSGRSTSRTGRPLGLVGGSGSQVPPLASCGSVFVATRRQPPRWAARRPRAPGQQLATRHFTSQNSQRGRLARCRPTVLSAMPGHKRHWSAGRHDAQQLLPDGACPRRPCPGLPYRGSHEPSCSQFAHRRCAYTRTSQHTSVAGMQVRRTMADASVRRGTGWWGSNPGTLLLLA